ncbi:DUF4112 domain-containing protein [Hoeflea olei]|uniref:DUF4112 domain-containing protein n=1 Tax=Hoeflea olei TaxID=1480615 RepID=A0A1C1Z1B0_9HYPH|nr:DUF4112 domain-containing protein [Hoeflea olei]OCW59509.1 hypothetical protein AWJ14_10860 [Hoeflea olei]
MPHATASFDPIPDQELICIERELVRLDRLARALDSQFRLPGTSLRLGFDTIVGLVPGIGDILTTAPATFIIWRAHRMGLGKHHLIRMLANTGLDFAIGSVPVIGDLFDAGFKSNLRNIAILRQVLGARQAARTGT